VGVTRQQVPFLRLPSFPLPPLLILGPFCCFYVFFLVFLLLCSMGFRFSFFFSFVVLFYCGDFFFGSASASFGACSVATLFAMAPSRTLCFPTVSSLCSRFCSLDGPGHVTDPFSTILYNFLVAPSLDCLHAFVGVAHLTCVPLMLYFPIFLLPILIREKKKKKSTPNVANDWAKLWAAPFVVRGISRTSGQPKIKR
jgi:hypothetical protein